MFDSLHGETLTITSRIPGPPDDLGEPNWTEATVEYKGCSIQPELNIQDALFTQKELASRWKVIGPDGVDMSGKVDGNSKISWNGVEYRLVSQVQFYRTPDGLLNHSEFFITRGSNE